MSSSWCWRGCVTAEVCMEFSYEDFLGKFSQPPCVLKAQGSEIKPKYYSKIIRDCNCLNMWKEIIFLFELLKKFPPLLSNSKAQGSKIYWNIVWRFMRPATAVTEVKFMMCFLNFIWLRKNMFITFHKLISLDEILNFIQDN